MCLGLSFFLFKTLYELVRILLYLVKYKINKLLRICISLILSKLMLVSKLWLRLDIIEVHYKFQHIFIKALLIVNPSYLLIRKRLIQS